MRNGAWNIVNDVTVRTDDRYADNLGGNVSIGGKQQSGKNIGAQVWERKLQGAQTDRELVQSPEGKDPATVPAGAIRYQVTANEMGTWNVQNATFTDELGSHLRYCGYVEVKHYPTGLSDTPATDAAAVAALDAMTPDQTVYVDVDGRDSYSSSRPRRWACPARGPSC